MTTVANQQGGGAPASKRHGFQPEFAPFFAGMARLFNVALCLALQVVCAMRKHPPAPYDFDVGPA